MNKRAIKDYKLFILVGFMMLVDVFTLSLWAYISPFTFFVTKMATYVSIITLYVFVKNVF